MTIVGRADYRGVGFTSRQIASAASCQVALSTTYRASLGYACSPHRASAFYPIGHDPRSMTPGPGDED